MTGHTITFVTTVPARYPHHAECSCGWRSRPMATAHAAELIADAHIEENTR